ncbi:MAG: hypothetical protein AAF637_28390, partial [Pseudomonadota bacterium]
MTDLLDHVRANAVEGDPGSVIAAIDDYDRARGAMIHVGPDKGAVLDQVVRDSGALRVLELGTNYGYSALRMTRNLPPSAIITTIEIDHRLAAIAEAVITFAGMADRITQIRGEARRVIPQLAEPLEQVEVVEIRLLEVVDKDQIERLG